MAKFYGRKWRLNRFKKGFLLPSAFLLPFSFSLSLFLLTSPHLITPPMPPPPSLPPSPQFLFLHIFFSSLPSFLLWAFANSQQKNELQNVAVSFNGVSRRLHTTTVIVQADPDSLEIKFLLVRFLTREIMVVVPYHPKHKFFYYRKREREKEGRRESKRKKRKKKKKKKER